MAQTPPALQSPEWWLARLSKKLTERTNKISVFDAYYRGEHNLAFATEKFQEAFGRRFASFSDNWCQLIPDAVDERLRVTGFRYGDDAVGDRKAWTIWQDNALDAMSQMVHLEALINGESYVSVWYDPDNLTRPVIAAEHPTEVYLEIDPGTQYRRAALKRWVDDSTGHVFANVYLPDGVYKFQSRRASESKLVVVGDHSDWVHRKVGNESWPLPNPFGVVPIVPFRNAPRLLSGGVSEIADAIPVQDAINKTISDLMVTSEFAAAPQRYAIGFTPEKDQNGIPKPMQALINRLITTSDPNTRFGEFAAADLTNFVAVVEMLVKHLASRTRTPPHYFYLSGQFPSGEAIVSAETGLVAKVKRKSLALGEAWEEVMRLAFVVRNDKGRSQLQSSETVWQDPESRSESQHIDAVLKKLALQVPFQQLWADAGYSPQQIERFAEMRAAEAQMGLTTTPTATAPTLPADDPAKTAATAAGAGQLPAGEA